MVLAAGASRRFGRPKQLEPVGPQGEALMDYAMFDALASGASDIAVVIRADTEASMEAHFASRDGLTPRFIHQPPPDAPARTKPWGTGQAMLTALQQVDDTCVILNADDYYGRTAVGASFRNAQSLDPSALQGAVAGYLVAQTLSSAGGVSRARLDTDAQGRLRAVVELVDVRRGQTGIAGLTVDGDRVRLAPDQLVSMNLWTLTPVFQPELERAFARFRARYGRDADREFLITEAATQAIEERDADIAVLPVDEPWFGLTFPDDRTGVVRHLAALTDRGLYPSPLFGV